MSADYWNKAQALFEAALDLDEAERAPFIDNACKGDDALRRDVLSLLEADAGAHSLLDGVALEAVDLEDAFSFEGQQVGPYRLLRRIGQGGMGAVYLAERVDGQFEQRVALKLIKRGMDSEQILRRFQSERQILARLEHPNIARLLDGGLTDDGRPYFAMEYVEGEPIDQYCDARRLRIDERLELFVTVCKAVLHAHARLVVHRDLKPENILVAEDEAGRPVVKLLDFGIAKLLEDEDEGLTRTGMAVMTPAYASPEQVRGEVVSTSTDIYSLGVVLYELLTGLRPYEVTSGSPAAAQAIVTAEPERPSTAVSKATSADESLSQLRGMQPERLRRRLSGDLDVICLKALRKEPERRYGSVEALEDDLHRHLTGLPVAARADTLGYRMQKFVARHRLGVGATAAGFALIATLVTFYTVQLQQERDRAQREAEKTEQVASFLRSIFEVSDPSVSKGETVTARELLDEGARRAEELTGQPTVQAQMLHVIGTVYHSLGLFDAALPFLERALAIRSDLYVANHPDVAASKLGLARVHEARGDYEAAERLLHDILSIRGRVISEEDLGRAEVLDDLGWIRYRKGDYEGAQAAYEKSLARRREFGSSDKPAEAQSLNNLAKVQHALGDYETAEALYRQALTLNREALGEKDREVATNISDLANLLNTIGQYNEAEKLHRQALALRRELLGPDHPHVTSSMNSLAVLLHTLHRYDEAEPLFREALALRQQRLGTEHPQVAVPLTGLAALLRDKGNLQEAEHLFRQSLDLHRKTLPAGHVHIAHPLYGLGALLTEKGAPEQAQPYLREAYTIRRQALPEGHWRIAQAAGALGACLADLGRYDAAEPYLLESYQIFRAQRGADHHMTQLALSRLVAAYGAWDRTEKAATYQALLTATAEEKTHK